MADPRVYATADLLRFRPGLLPPGLGETTEPEPKQNALGYKVKEVQCVLPAKPPLKPGRQKGAKTTTKRRDKAREDPAGVQASDIACCKDVGSLRTLLWQLAFAAQNIEATGGFDHCGVRLLIEMGAVAEQIREMTLRQHEQQAAISIQKGWRDVQEKFCFGGCCPGVQREARKLAALKELERLEAQRGAPLPFLPAQAAPWWPQAAAPIVPRNANELLNQLKHGASPPLQPQQPQLDGRSLLQMLGTPPPPEFAPSLPPPVPAPSANSSLDGRALLQQIKPQSSAPPLDGRALLQQIQGPMAPPVPPPAVPPILTETEAPRTFDLQSFFRTAELAQQGAAPHAGQEARGSGSDVLTEFVRAAKQSQGQRDQLDVTAAKPVEASKRIVPDPEKGFARKDASLSRGAKACRELSLPRSTRDPAALVRVNVAALPEQPSELNSKLGQQQRDFVSLQSTLTALYTGVKSGRLSEDLLQELRGATCGSRSGAPNLYQGAGRSILSALNEDVLQTLITCAKEISDLCVKV
eukprot:s953_g7.t1